MLFAVLHILFIASARGDIDNGLKEKSCVLPPFPKHGTYTLQDPANLKTFAPGDQLPSYVLDVICEDGYIQTHKTQSCLGGWKSDEDPPECLQFCNNTGTVGVLSCGVMENGAEAKCIASNIIATAAARITAENELKCGSPEPFSVVVIAGGRVASEEELPWHVGIYTKTSKPYRQICGGSIVSSNLVISAAHCFWNDIEKLRPASTYAVAAGKMYRPFNNNNDIYAQKSDVSEIRVPPRFQGSTTSFQDDIALVVLGTPFKFTSRVKPVCLDFDLTFEEGQIKPGTLGKVAGWGLTSEDGKESPVLQVVEIPVVSIEECITNSDPAFTRHITSDKICAGFVNGTSVCKGDSGGGLVFPQQIRGVERYFLRGVVSTAPRTDHLCNTVSWATFTRVLNHYGFIRDMVPEGPAISTILDS